MNPIQLQLPPQGVLKPNDENDPLPYYYHPWVGWLYRHRLQMGLDMLPTGGKRVLEIGVGSGVLVPTLTRHYAEYTGTDLTLAAGLDALVAPGCRATFRPADLLRDGDLPAEHFDAIVCFSVLEHIADADGAARSLARALVPGGTLVTGYPMVNPLMSRAFEAIGFQGIDNHHVSPPSRIAAALGRVLRPTGRHAFPPAAPVGMALYQCTAWQR
ncbi:MAG TPA: class I SAM-dependent methyltransferase [Polyangia bacterium]|jgi:2-polyprenyl-3-methyl-5-hydroxy-6-metoxy-1,4-benzoquinol methylase|nr:class I SAM-dependent methyltransferase [Polyangia bacterium]